MANATERTDALALVEPQNKVDSLRRHDDHQEQLVEQQVARNDVVDVALQRAHHIEHRRDSDELGLGERIALAAC